MRKVCVVAVPGTGTEIDVDMREKFSAHIQRGNGVAFFFESYETNIVAGFFRLPYGGVSHEV